MRYGTRVLTTLACVAPLALLVPPAAGANSPAGQEAVTELATFGSGLGSGSTVGPDGALYVTDGVAGTVLRIDPRSGETTTVADGLPTMVIDIGGAMDVAFLDGRLYVLVTLVGGNLLTPAGPQSLGDSTVGIYQLDDDGTFSVVADIGTWSMAHPPTPGFFIDSGVQYALQAANGGFLVSDGHHNRVLRVTMDGDISELVTFTDLVPTGLEVLGGMVLIAQAGPIPHRPEDSKIVAVGAAGGPAIEVGAGRGGEEDGLAVDVELGADHQLYALLQGTWTLDVDEQNEGLPAAPDTGSLARVEGDGSFTTVADNLDRPTSLELIGDTAYVVTLDGTVLRIPLGGERAGDHERSHGDGDGARHPDERGDGSRSERATPAGG